MERLAEYEWFLYRTGEEPIVISREEMEGVVKAVDFVRVLEGSRRLVLKVDGFKYYEGRR